MPTYEIHLEPLDPLLFGDNRSARAGADHMQLDQDPSPLTLHGAIGQYLATQAPEWPHESLGERQRDILAPEGSVAELLGYCHHRAGGSLLFPRPRHLRCTLARGQPRPLDFLRPRQAPGARSSGGWRDLLLPTETEPLDNEAEGEILLSESALGDVLCGEVPGSVELPDGLFRPEPRPGIAVDNGSGTVFEGLFFTRPYRRFQPAPCDPAARGTAAGFTAWLETLAPIRLASAASIGFLGGDRRRARFEFRALEASALSELCEQVAATAETSTNGGFLLYLLTPALQMGALPAVEGLAPVAAALGNPAYASGWDVARNQPRPLRSLIPSGSTFFFEWPTTTPSGTSRAELIRRLWLQPLHPPGAAAGFGRCLPGIWR